MVTIEGNDSAFLCPCKRKKMTIGSNQQMQLIYLKLVLTTNSLLLPEYK